MSMSTTPLRLFGDSICCGQQMPGILSAILLSNSQRLVLKACSENFYPYVFHYGSWTGVGAIHLWSSSIGLTMNSARGALLVLGEASLGNGRSAMILFVSLGSV